nr:heavy-metal-associated domain-containing protein [Natrinema sp. SYSU A 869]
MEQTTLAVTDMSSDDCERTVTEALEALEGVAAARADREIDEVRVDGRHGVAGRDHRRRGLYCRRVGR